MNFLPINTMLSTVGNLIDKLTTTSKEKDEIKQAINAAILNNINTIVNAEKDILIEESRGNWLQRSWRPIVMLTFTFIVVLGIFIDIPLLKTDSPFWDLLELGIGGYVIGRSAEKITSTIGKKLFK